MALDDIAFDFLTYVSLKGPLGKTLTLGKQGNNLSSNLSSFIHSYDSCENVLINQFGATQVESIDISPYESATIIHDLQKPLPPNFSSLKFDTVIDIGTMEHIFDLSSAFKCLFDLTNLYGRIVHVQCLNDWVGHGLVQFSPDLFYSLYSPHNGFEHTEMFFVELKNSDFWTKCSLPFRGSRVELTGLSVPLSYILVVSTKIKNIDAISVVQSDYLYQHELSNNCTENIPVIQYEWPNSWHEHSSLFRKHKSFFLNP